MADVRNNVHIRGWGKHSKWRCVCILGWVCVCEMFELNFRFTSAVFTLSAEIRRNASVYTMYNGEKRTQRGWSAHFWLGIEIIPTSGLIWIRHEEDLRTSLLRNGDSGTFRGMQAGVLQSQTCFFEFSLILSEKNWNLKQESLSHQIITILRYWQEELSTILFVTTNENFSHNKLHLEKQNKKSNGNILAAPS